MLAQYDNILMSNFQLWLDNFLLTNGDAYSNTASVFYRVGPVFNGYYTYGVPFSQFVHDQSITGANVPTGVYIGESFVITGQSGFVSLDYARGQAHFSSEITGQVSGRYSVKDFNIYLSSEPEEKILFETQYTLRPKIPQIPTGQANNEISYPAIVVRNNGRYNEPLAFGGEDNSVSAISAYVFADSQFKLDAALSLLADANGRILPLLTQSEMPFNVFGGFKTGNFNYTGAVAGKSPSEKAYICRSFVSKFERNLYSKVKELNPAVYFGIVDIEVEKPRYPRISTRI